MPLVCVFSTFFVLFTKWCGMKSLCSVILQNYIYIDEHKMLTYCLAFTTLTRRILYHVLSLSPTHIWVSDDLRSIRDAVAHRLPSARLAVATFQSPVIPTTRFTSTGFRDVQLSCWCLFCIWICIEDSSKYSLLCNDYLTENYKLIKIYLRWIWIDDVFVLHM